MSKQELDIRKALVTDYPGIYVLQKLFFDSRGTPIQTREPGLTWIVVVTAEDNTVVGCYSFIDNEFYKQRVVQDFYRASGRNGARALILMQNHLEYHSKKDNLSIAFVVEHNNIAWMNKLDRAGYEIAGVLFCKQSSNINI